MAAKPISLSTSPGTRVLSAPSWVTSDLRSWPWGPGIFQATCPKFVSWLVSMDGDGFHW